LLSSFSAFAEQPLTTPLPIKDRQPLKDFANSLSQSHFHSASASHPSTHPAICYFSPTTHFEFNIYCEYLPQNFQILKIKPSNFEKLMPNKFQKIFNCKVFSE